jgi:hypothetical protein
MVSMLLELEVGVIILALLRYLAIFLKSCIDKGGVPIIHVNAYFGLLAAALPFLLITQWADVYHTFSP